MKKLLSLLLVSIFLFSFVGCSAKKAEETDLNSVEKATITNQTKESLTTVYDELTFIEKYAGNVNSAGKRKFADEAIASLQDLNNLDMSLVSKYLPEIYDSILAIQNECNSIADLIIDMGETNSDENVPTIKANATSTKGMITDVRSQF